MLDVVGIADRFSAVVDGVRAPAEGLPGKPNPHTYLRAGSAVNSGT